MNNIIDSSTLIPGEMTPDQQLEQWVLGKSIHNNNRYIDIVDENDNVTERVKMDGGECCPDFSCCQPKLLWPRELREKFKDSSDEIRNEMLMMSLSALLNSEKVENVYIAGNTPVTPIN